MSKIKIMLSYPTSRYKTLIRWYGVKLVIIASLIIIIGIVVIIYKIANDSSTEADLTQPTKTAVSVTTAQAYSAKFSGTLIGNAVATTEATLLAERGGQVTSVPVTLGQYVQAGTVLARFANETESAALTQARGTYQSAVASAEQSLISISDAESQVRNNEIALLTTYNNAGATVAGILAVTVDEFFSNPNNSTPGLRINGGGKTQRLNDIRNTTQKQLFTWQKNSAKLTVDSDMVEAMRIAKSTIENTIVMVDIFISIFQRESGGPQYSSEEYGAYISSFSTVRTTLNNLLTNFSTAESNLQSAKDNVERAKLGGGNTSSLASAGITQARGALQAAQANYNKTIIRAPISGTIATIAVRSGDYVGAQTLVAKITNTDGVEITTYISESERDYFTIGDTVNINNTTTGTISAISPAIDSLTQKVEVRISVSDNSIKSGNTVTISLPNDNQTASESTSPITIPITAIKFTNTDREIFVVENDVLVAKAVELGAIVGGMVTILSGIDNNTEFVVDARGKNAGEVVEIITK